MATLTYESVVQAYRDKLCSVDASAVPGTVAFQFDVEGKAHGIFYVEIKDGKINVEPYEYYDRNAIITASGTNLIKLINGKIDPVVAFTTGKLKVDGDVGAALELIKYIHTAVYDNDFINNPYQRFFGSFQSDSNHRIK